MSLTLGNPIGGVMSFEVKANIKTIDISGKSLSTGIKVDNDIVSNFLGKKLRDKAFLQKETLKTICYCSSVLGIAQNSISTMATTIVSMLAIIAQAENCSDKECIILNDMLQQKFKLVESQRASAVFNDKELLTGEFGANSEVRTHYDTKIVDIRKQGVGSGVNFAGAGAKDQKILDFSNPILFQNLSEGQFIILRGEKFTFVNGAPKNENEVTLGKTPLEMASNLTTAIRNNSSESLRSYNVTARNGQTLIVQRSASALPIPLIVPTSIDASSAPSTYSLEFLGAANVESNITIAGETFIFGNDAGEIPPRAGYATAQEASAKNLAYAIENNLNTKALIEQGLLSVSANNWGVVTIKSTMSKAILGVNGTNTTLNIRNNLITESAATTYGKSIKLNSVPANGDTVNINGTLFTFVAGFPVAPTDVDIIGGNISQTIVELNNTIMTVDPGGLIAKNQLSLNVDRVGNTFTVYSDIDVGLNYTHIVPVPIANQAVIRNAAISDADTAILKPSIDISEIRNIEGFINTPTSSFKVIAGATSKAGDGAAAALYSQVTEKASPTVSANNDSFAVIEARVAGRVFQALFWKGAAAANIDSRAIVFKEASASETFTVNIGINNYNPDIIANTGGLVNDIQTLFSTTQFAQTRDLEIFTVGGQIIDEIATVIGDVAGMTVSLNSADFNDKNFENFELSQALGGGITFTATISGQKFSTSLAVNELAEGAVLKLESLDNDDTLVINIGKGGLSSLQNPKNYSIIEHAMKKSLLSIGVGINVKISSEAKEEVTVRLDDISTNKLYRDSKDKYVQGVNLLTKSSIKVAQEVLTNALKIVREIETKIISYNQSIATYAENLKRISNITKESSNSYLNTDLIESAMAFSESLKYLIGSLGVIEAGNEVSKAAERVITNTAAAT